MQCPVRVTLPRGLNTDVNVCRVVQFIDTEKPERTERMFTVAHDTMIFLQKQLHMCGDELSK